MQKDQPKPPNASPNFQGEEDTQARMGNLVDQILKQQQEKAQARLSGKKPKFRLYTSSRDIYKAVAVLAIILIWSQLYNDKQRAKDRPVDDGTLAVRSHQLDGEEVENQLGKPRSSLQDAASKDLNIDKLKDQAANSLRDLAKQFRDGQSALSNKEVQLAAKIITEPERVQTQVSNTEKYWQALLTCSIHAPLRAIPIHHRLGDDFLMLHRGANVYLYTPNFAGKQQVFKQFYWQKPIVTILRKLGKSTDGWIPAINLAVPYFYYANGIGFRAYMYADVDRGNRVNLFGAALGDAFQLYPESAERPTILPEAAAKMWDSGKQPQLDTKAVALVGTELQLRLQKPIAAAFSYDSQPYLDSERRRYQVLLSCQQAAQHYALPKLKAWAVQQIDNYKKRGTNSLTPYLETGPMRLSGNYPGALVESYLRMNLPVLQECLESNSKRLERNLSGSVALRVESSGDVKQVQIISDTSNLPTKRATSCLAAKLADLPMPAVGGREGSAVLPWVIK